MFTCFRNSGITLDLAEILSASRALLYEIIDTINAEYGVNLQKETLEPVYRAEVARLFDSELEIIPGAAALLDAVKIPMCVVSNGPVSKMQHSLGRTQMLHHFPRPAVQRLRHSALETRPGADVPCGRGHAGTSRKLYSGR